MKMTRKGLLAAYFLLLACGEIGSARAQAAPAAAKAAPAPQLSSEAQKAAQADADHLLQMAQQLKATLDATRRDELSVKAMREADGIEKLARSLKARIH